MFLKKIDWYILKQVKSPVIFSFFIFASLWIVNLLIHILNLVVQKGVGLEALFKIVIYQLPSIIVTSVPMAVLMGTMLGITRLNNDSELTAIKAAGISPFRLIMPLLFVGAIISTGVFFLNEIVVPQGRFLMQQVYINEITLKKPLPKIVKDIFIDGGKKFKLFIRQYDAKDEIMRDVTLFQFGTVFPQITKAKTAQISGGSLWTFKNGKTIYFDRTGKTEYVIRFEEWIYPISDRYAGNIVRNPENKSPSEMNMKELKKQILIRQQKKLSPKEFQTQYYWRSSFPFATIFMILVGAPLAMKPTRSGKANGFGMGLLIMILYYVLLATGKSLGGNGSLDPMLANWIPNATSFTIGIILLYKSRY
ncbi:MAG: LptF/LptG family permease [Candidatus Cloacimonetes bacterium]|nr:LptF/LptG family permease [Candidatus Cloacimonadota bacterium]